MTRPAPITDPHADYFAAPGLSNSMLSDLAISPLRFWHRWINPDRPPDEPTPAMQFGTAVHCAVCEPDEFEKRYALEFQAPEGCLYTIEDLRGWLRDHGHKPKGTHKADVMGQVYAIDPNAPIYDLMRDRHEGQHDGKTFCRLEDWQRVLGAANALRSEPSLADILTAGWAEQAIFATDPETGVLLKARLDWVTPTHILDLKTFSVKHGKSIDRAVADALYFEGYLRQAYFYWYVWSLGTFAGSQLKGIDVSSIPRFVFAFVESEAPHEVRVKAIRPTDHGIANLYWENARVETHSLIRLYRDCLEKWGDKQWRIEQEIEALVDEDIRQLAY